MSNFLWPSRAPYEHYLQTERTLIPAARGEARVPPAGQSCNVLEAELTVLLNAELSQTSPLVGLGMSIIGTFSYFSRANPEITFSSPVKCYSKGPIH